MNLLDNSIEYLKGVGPLRADTIKKELGLFTFRNLLNYFPFRYIDRSKFYSIDSLHEDLPYVQIKGRITNIQVKGKARGQRLMATFSDDTGSMELVWFKGIKWVKSSLKPGLEYIVFGKPSVFNGRVNVAHPEMELVSTSNVKQSSSLQPVYSTTEKLTAKNLNSKGIEKLQKALLSSIYKKLGETLPDDIINQLKLMSRRDAYLNIHFPQSEIALQKATFRLKFEELFYVQLQILRLKLYRSSTTKGYVFGTVGENFNHFYKEILPFELTGAQKRVIKEVRKDLAAGKQMNRLLQGDVGSGKTMVALLVMLIAIDNGFQSAMMAPTEILANQHYEGISELLENTDLKVALLTGSTKTAERKVLFEQLKSGELHILIGTHALLEDKVVFNNLGLVIIDEQHRFGVAQRSRMWKKNTLHPHILVMSATPIPRTLAMTLYGDLDVSVIDELPPGRKPIQTLHKSDSHRLRIFQFMRDEIAKGRQIYVVYPLIQESEKMDYKDLMDGYESLSRAFPQPEFQISIVHGKMKAQDKDAEMQRFVEGKTQIMVATTVIEVGVNVPNASVMVIESAERFGLSQLHQLRGRVGRGAEQSYCILMTGNKLSSDSKTRMETMVRTNDGFEVSEADLKLRGPGDLMGTQQSGILNLSIADLAKDGEILKIARQTAATLLKDDPNFSQPKNARVKINYQRFAKERPNWSKIS